MVFFESAEVPKTNKIGITNLLSNITTREGSHKGGWARLLKCQLINLQYESVKILDNKDSLSDFDTIVFDLGAEYSGALNMFGGLDEKVFKRLNEIKNFTGDLYSWCNDIPDLSILESRRTNASTCEAFKATTETFIEEVNSKLETCQTFLHVYRTKKVLIGDSHTPSVWTPEFMIERRDGRTLKGLVDRGTIHNIVNINFRLNGIDINEVQIHCGSIDIRHHLGREINPLRSTADLATGLLDKLMNVGDVHVKVTHTMGIEDESRELPKTGYFKGTAFYGSWDLRNRMREVYNAVMDELPNMDHDTEVIKFPEYFFDESGKLKFKVMENGGSVHISPEHYRWDLDNNKLRWNK